MAERKTHSIQPQETLTQDWQVIKTHPLTLYGKQISSEIQTKMPHPEARGATQISDVELAVNLVKRRMQNLSDAPNRTFS